MRRILSVFLAALLLLTFSSAALADPEITVNGNGEALVSADVAAGGHQLTVEITLGHGIHINQRQMADTGSHQRLGTPSANASHTHQQHPGCLQLPERLFANQLYGSFKLHSVCHWNASQILFAARMPSIAELVMPPAYPAPSPQG